jgi:hypothetical protein
LRSSTSIPTKSTNVPKTKTLTANSGKRRGTSTSPWSRSRFAVHSQRSPSSSGRCVDQLVVIDFDRCSSSRRALAGGVGQRVVSAGGVEVSHGEGTAALSADAR